MRKKICPTCGKIVDENHDCPIRKQRAYEYKKELNKKESQKVIKTKQWRQLRPKILKRDLYECQRCLIKFGIHNRENLQIDHIIPRTARPDLAYEPTNLITLCARCNKEKGTKSELDFEPKTLQKNIENDEFFL